MTPEASSLLADDTHTMMKENCNMMNIPTVVRRKPSFGNMNLLDTTTSSLEAFSRSASTASLSGLDLDVTAAAADLINNRQDGSTTRIQMSVGSLVNATVLLLLFVGTFTEVALRGTRVEMYQTNGNSVSFQSDNSNKSYFLDALSMEVLFPSLSGDNNINKNSKSPGITEKRKSASPKLIIKGSSREAKAYNHNNQNRLGSALIESVTNILSPILPFAGGIDLRRDENWKRWRQWFHLLVHKKQKEMDKNESKKPSSSKSTLLSSVPRGGGRDHGHHEKSKRGEPSLALSVEEPFFPTKGIEQMTLKEIVILLRYSIESNRDNFNMKNFPSKGKEVNALTRKAIDAIDNATAKSRGDGTLPAIMKSIDDLSNVMKNGGALTNSGYGDVDALQFCAAMRLFAEWRVLRQVPPGYKGYAVGMSLGHKDVVQNLAKIEIAVHDWMDYQESKSVEEPWIPRSPTLRQLLEAEIERDAHPNNRLPFLKENTAAMGLLWVRRQLQYQTTIFNNIMSVPQVFPTMISAVGAAYTEVYGDLHGWAVQKIFNYSFQSAPDAEEIFRHMNPNELSRVLKVAATENHVEEDTNKEDEVSEVSVTTEIGEGDPFLGARSSPVDGSAHVSTRNLMAEKTKTNDNPFVALVNHIGSEIDKIGKNIEGEMDKLGRHVVSEWDKFACNVGNIFHQHDNDCDLKKGLTNSSERIRGGAQKKGLHGEILEKFVNQQMTDDARHHISTYLTVAQPILQDLAGLFAEMNMDDPTKV